MTPYFFKQMRKRTGLCLVVVLTALAFSLALCMLQRSRDQMAARIEEVYDNLEVRCSVTNLTGTQSDRLNLPEWVLRLFTTGMTTGNFQEDGLFTPYVRDVQVRSTVYCTQPGGTVPHALSGITGLAADSALQPDSGCTILWREGFDASVVQGRGYSLLLPEELAAWEDEDGYVTLEFSPSSGETEQHRFLVVGTYASGAGRLYCPWWVARQLCLDVYGAITMDSLSAAMADNRRIDQFWDEYGSRYFVEPTRDGTPVPWEGSLMYRTYPFALAIYDDTLVKTVDQLHQNQKLLGLVSWLLGLSAFGVGAVFSILLLRHRSRELKLQYILGQARGGILLWALVEHGLLSLLGAAIGAGGFCVAFRTAPAWGPVAVFWGMNLAGTALAYLLTMRRTFLETNLGRE